MRKDYRVERATVIRTSSKTAIDRTITLIEGRIAQCWHFYPWPALVESWQQDIQMLQERLDDGQSKKSA